MPIEAIFIASVAYLAVVCIVLVPLFTRLFIIKRRISKLDRDYLNALSEINKHDK